MLVREIFDDVVKQDLGRKLIGGLRANAFQDGSACRLQLFDDVVV
ncbi:MAG: hypothetical protein ACR2RL_05430 [Gammaproteobacteria bacterium]